MSKSNNKETDNESTEPIKREREKVRKSFFRRANQIENSTELVDFIEEITTLKDIDTATRVALSAIASASYMGRGLGISSSETGFVMHDFINNYVFSPEVGSKIVHFDNLMYPQYKHLYEKTISQEVWDSIVKKTTEKLNQHNKALEEANKLSRQLYNADYEDLSFDNQHQIDITVFQNFEGITIAGADVAQHWQSIVEGEIPFGYQIEEGRNKKASPKFVENN